MATCFISLSSYFHKNREIPFCKDSTSSTSTTSLYFLSWAISGIPPTRVHTIGVPAASDSTRTLPNPSEREGSTRTLASAMCTARFSGERKPPKITYSSRLFSEIIFFISLKYSLFTTLPIIFNLKFGFASCIFANALTRISTPLRKVISPTKMIVSALLVHFRQAE